MFLHYLLSRDENELVSQVLKAQMDDPIKGDWILTIKQELEDFDLNLCMETIKQLKKEKFKNIIKKACKKAAFKFLMQKKQA